MELNNKLNQLEEVKRLLKNDFVGLDSQIDKIIDNIKIWYCMPELLTHPVIINLWGMTGTGKTDLVRKLANYLDFSSKLLEIQMDTDLDCGWQRVSTLKKALQYSDIEEGERGIVLLDEFQRFNSKNLLTGDDIEHERYNDVWMLLSDGKFNIGASRTQSEIDEFIFEEEEIIKRHKKESKEENDDGDAKEYLEKGVGIYRAKFLKKLLRLKTSIREIAGMTPVQVVELCKKSHTDSSTYNNSNYSKCLIFVCGNLDGAYSMASEVADADLDADILHKYSKRINLVTVKKSLFDLFKPEQVARFGNNHIIYPCLNSSNYKQIIRRCVDKFKEGVKDNIGSTFTYNDKVVDIFYKNFVFPSQGVRPVISGINSFLSKVLPPLFFDAINNHNNATVELDAVNKEIRAYIDGSSKIVNYDFDLETIKKQIPLSKRTMFGVHEAGHTLVYALLFKRAPRQINTEITNFDGAYVVPDVIFYTKRSYLDAIKVYLAGLAAEEIVFGDMQRSIGCGNDISKATNNASLLVRYYGMDGLIGKYCPETEQGVSTSGITDFDKTNSKVETILENAHKDVLKMINDNRHLLKKISDELLNVKSMNGKDFFNLMKNDIPDLTYSDPLEIDLAEEVVYDYSQKYQQFKTTSEK